MIEYWQFHIVQSKVIPNSKIKLSVFMIMYAFIHTHIKYNKKSRVYTSGDL